MPRTLTSIAALLVVAGLAAADDAAPDSVTERDGRASLRPIARIAHPRIDECSGIVSTGGAYYVHNDSGDDPVVYRSTTLDFADAEVLKVHKARAVDWEDVTVLDGDLVLGDAGDNRRHRKHVVLYRVRYVPGEGGAPGSLERIATYRVRYPDGPHDCEGLYTKDGVIHMVTKVRGEPATQVWTLDDPVDQSDLKRGEANTPTLLTTLDLGPAEQVTAADCDPTTGAIAMLTYTRILVFPGGRLDRPPVETRIAARQCEGLCFDGGDLIFTNEQRDVYRVDRYLQRSFSDLLPPIGSGTLPVCAAGCDLTSGACDHSGPVSVQGLREGEHLRWVLAGGRIHLQGRLIPAGPLQETKPGGRQLGTCVLLLFGRAPTLWLSSAETQLAIVADGDGQPMLRRLDLTADRVDLQEVKGATFAAVSETDPAGPYVSFSASFPASLALGDDPSATSFRCELRSLGLHGDGGDLTLTGLDPTALFHPYAWAEIEVKR